MDPAHPQPPIDASTVTEPNWTDDRTESNNGTGSTGTNTPIDLDRIERELAEVEAALERLDAGTYGIDEVTGAPIPDDVLVADPLARRASA